MHPGKRGFGVPRHGEPDWVATAVVGLVPHPSLSRPRHRCVSEVTSYCA